MKTTSVTVMVFFSKVPFWNYLIKPCSKFFLKELQDTLTTVFKTIHYSWRFHGHGSQYEVIFSSLNTLNKNWRMCLENQHLRNNPILLFEEYCTKTFRLLLHAPFFSQINLVYIFHIALFRYFLPQFTYLFTVSYSVYFGVNPDPSCFL